MEDQLVDMKLKQLIKICKETGNIKKISSTCFILIGNELHRIGIYLGMRPRLKEKEYYFQYMQNINAVIRKNLEIILIPEMLINRLKEIEFLFHKKKGIIPLVYTKNLIEIFYELRKVEVPNIFLLKWNEGLFAQNEMGILQSFYAGSSKKCGNTGIKAVYLQKLKQKEQKLKHSLRSNFDPQVFESIIVINKLKKDLEKDTGKIIINTTLSESMDYQRSLNSIVGYLYLGSFVLFLLLSITLILESILRPSLTLTLSGLLLVFIAPAVVCLVIYWNYFRKPEGSL
ncbi:MAG: hypothetical protein ACTSR8_14015 [Promethearchaeota archaeon]